MPHSGRLCKSAGLPVMLTAGGPARARVPARRSASGSRYRSAMRGTWSAVSALGLRPRWRNRAAPRIRARLAPRGWPREPGLGHLGHRDAGLGVRARGRAGRQGPGRHSHRPPASPVRSGRPGPRAAAQASPAGSRSR